MGTEIKQIDGYSVNKDKELSPEKIIVTFKSDADGETIILKGGDVMIGAPFKEIAKMIEKARKRK